MAYNTNTRLLLKFNESNGSTSTSDSSEWSRTLTLGGTAEISSTQGKFSTNSLSVGNTSNSVGDVLVSSPGDVFSDSVTSHKQFDFWFYREASPPWGIQPLVSITFQNGDSVLLWRGSSSYELEINSTNWNTDYTYQSYTDYNGYQTWVHLRLKIVGQDYYVGLDGAEIMAGSSANGWNLWAGGSGNPVTQFRIGGWPTGYGQDANAYVRGYIDAYQVLEGDTSWTGGGYTVPTAEPDSYVGGGGNVTVGLTGQSFSISQGAIAPNRSRSLTGQSFSYAQGFVTPQVGSNVTIGLTGQAYGYSQGEFGKTRTRALTGQSFSYTQGAVTPVVGVTVSLTGQAFSFSQGAIGNSHAIATAGQSLTLSQGSVTSSQSIAVALTGHAFSYAQGGLQANRTKALTGQSFSISPGGLYTGTPLVGANTVADVVSTGVGGDPANHHDLYTTLMLHFSNGEFLKDSSLYNQTVIQNSDGVVSINTATPILGSGSADFATTNVGGLEVIPGGVFFDSTTDKVIDIIYKPVSRSGTNQNIFYVTFPGSAYNGGGSCYVALEVHGTNNRMYLTVRTPTMRLLSYETSAVITYGSANYIRLAFINDRVYLARNGTQLVNQQTDFGGDVWPNSHFNRLQIGLYAYGLMDSVRIQEGSSANHGYSGGSYSPWFVDSEWYPDARTASGANTTEAVISVGDGLVLPEILATGASTLDNMLGEGNTNVGVWIEATGSVTLEGAAGSGEANTLPVIGAIGANTTGSVSSSCNGYIEWIGRGENTLEAFVGSGAGELKNFNEGAGVSATSVSSSGVGFVAVSCAGENETSVTSVGEGVINAYMMGESETSVSSVGEGFLIRFIDQWNTTTSVSSSGEAIAFFDAVGSSVAEVLSVGYGECPIAGQGQSTAFVETYAGIPVGLLESAVLEYAHSKPDVVYVR